MKKQEIIFTGIITHKSDLNSFAICGKHHIHYKMLIESPDGQSIEADAYDGICTQGFLIGDNVEALLEAHVYAGKKCCFNKLKIKEIKKVS